MSAGLLVLVLSVLPVLLPAPALVPCLVLRGALAPSALPSILLALGSRTSIATTSRIVLILGPLATVLLAGGLMALSLPAAVPAATFTAVLGGLAPVA